MNEMLSFLEQYSTHQLTLFCFSCVPNTYNSPNWITFYCKTFCNLFLPLPLQPTSGLLSSQWDMYMQLWYNTPLSYGPWVILIVLLLHGWLVWINIVLLPL